VLKAYNFRVYSTKAQKTKMEQTLDLCRWVYNQTLALRKNTWENEGKSTSKHDTHNLLTTWKDKRPELKDVFAQVLQNVQLSVEFRCFISVYIKLRCGYSARLWYGVPSLWQYTRWSSFGELHGLR